MTGAPTITLSIILIVVIRQKFLLNKFRNSNATAANTAKTLEELNVSRRWMFNRLLMREVIIDVNGKYYLDEQNLKELRTKKARILLPLVFLILIAAIILDIFLSK